jgi:hypothetical protein
MMEKAGKTRAPWRSWTIAALTLMVLALAQACSDSGNRPSTPTTTKSSAVALKIKRAPLVPAGCSGTLAVDGPNGFHTEAAIAPSGSVTLTGLPTGVPLTFTVFVTCSGQTASGSTTVTLGPGINNVSIPVVLTKAGISCNPSTIAQGGESTSCTCTIQVPDPSSFTVDWQGATPTGPTTAKFTTDNATSLGSHTVTCTVNNVASASTNVTVVAAPVPVSNGTIQVENTTVDCEQNPQLCLRTRKVLAQHIFGSFYARVRQLPSGPPSAAQHPGPQETATFSNLSPGNYRVEFSCGASFFFISSFEDVTVSAGGTVTVERDVFDVCAG